MMASNTKNTTTTAAEVVLKPPEHGLQCPRCDSSNTKFCYYNNYSLSQPRHFCKTCRRYWTKGGALRNVPVGGACRQSKKPLKSVFSSSSPLSATQLVNFNLGFVPRTQFVGFNYPVASAGLDEQMFRFHHGGVGCSTDTNNVASSIESLSSINQDFHWKLQQQRLAMMFGDASQNKIEINSHVHQVEPISFQVGEGSSKGETFGAKLMGTAQSHDAAASATTWFFDSTSANYNNGRINGRNISSSSNNHHHASDWNGVANWSDMPQFSALP